MPETKAAFKRQYVNFAYYKIRPEWWLLSKEEKTRAKDEFLQIFNEYSQKMILLTYSTIGIRADAEWMLWRISYRLEDFEEMSTKMFSTGFGKYCTPSYSYLSQTKRSTYIDKISPEHTESRTRILPGKSKYIFVYPFVKTRAWYLLPHEERQLLMDEHIRIGTKYQFVKLNTTYSFGLDDQEFVVAFETDSPSDFLDLVMELRESQASKYTLRDTPTYTCILKPIKELLAGL